MASLSQMVDVPFVLPLAIVLMFRSSGSDEEPTLDVIQTPASSDVTSALNTSYTDNHSCFTWLLLTSTREKHLNSFPAQPGRAEESFVWPRWDSKLLVPVERAAIGTKSIPQLTFDHPHPDAGSVRCGPVISWQWAPFWHTYWWWTDGHRSIDQTHSHRKSSVGDRPGLDVWLCEQQVVDVLWLGHLPVSYTKRKTNGNLMEKVLSDNTH